MSVIVFKLTGKTSANKSWFTYMKKMNSIRWAMFSYEFFINFVNLLNFVVTNPITVKVLKEDFGLVNPANRKVTFEPLTEEELPKEGDVVALDAEFVSLNQVI